SSPRASAGMWSPCPRMPASSSGRWTSQTWTSSTGFLRRCRSIRRRPAATRGRPSGPSPRPTTTCGFCRRGGASRTARSVARRTPQQIVDQVLEPDEGTRFQVLAPVVRGRKGEYTELLRELQVKGFSRARVDGVVVRLDEAGTSQTPALKKYEKHTIEVVVD